MEILELLKAVLFGIVEGITEWLPISSTGHMSLFNQFVKLNVSEDFWKLFEVVIQFGAILAVVLLFWNKLWPFTTKTVKVHRSKNETGSRFQTKKKVCWKRGALDMWLKIIVACIPAAIVGLIFDDKIDELFYHPIPVAIALIVVGIVFIVVENAKKGSRPAIRSIGEITYKAAIIIGLFQLIAAVFPGTSRSGATIIGALIIGVSRSVAAEFTFFLAVPVMFGASLLKIAKYAAVGMAMTGTEWVVLIVGCLVAFFVSVFVIKFLMGYIKKHDFKVFGVYRIILGIAVIALSFVLF